MREGFIPHPEGRIFIRQWGTGPLLLFAHATGMCGQVYTDLLDPLADRYRIVTFDARGHGRTELPADPAHIPFDWKIYRQDIRHIVEYLGGGPIRLAGHSFGASSIFEAAMDYPGMASSVVLIDPPFIPRADVESYRLIRGNVPPSPQPMSDQAARRRPAFESRAAAKAAYQGRGVFAGWPERVLDDYLDGGLLPDGDQMRLACRPAWEAVNYRAVTTTLMENIAICPFPFTLLCASDGSTVPLSEEAAIRATKPDATVIRYPDTGHFLAVTHPELIRPHLARMP